MKYTLRPYQEDAVNAVMDFIVKSVASCVVVLPTGAGKSMVVAEVAHRINVMSGKRVLCTAPSKELVLQNRGKYLLTGEPAGLFSASAGAKNLRHPVVFGSPLTIKGALEMFGEKYGAIIIDEGDGITPTLKAIISSIKRKNPKLRVITLTATPYRLGTGYIYKDHYTNGPTDEENATDPYYDHVVYELPAKFLIDNGFLTPPTTTPTEDNYDTSLLKMDGAGKFTNASLEKAFSGQGRKTSKIISDVVMRSHNRNGVMIFAATRKHAEEITASLPEGSWRCVFGDTPSAERDKYILDFKSQKFKYIVNVSVLTKGFDAPHVDHIAVLRATESPGLFQQIVGRGTRLFEGKNDFLVSDYAGNIERHFADTGDIFTPEIKANKKRESVPMDISCPLCRHVNDFAARPNDEGLLIDSEGYFIDLEGDRIKIQVMQKIGDNVEYIEKEVPAHFGRRCKGVNFLGPLRELKRCTYKWSFKECPECNAENDIAARYCSFCKAEIVDPNTRLDEQAAMLDNAKDATKQDKVIDVSIRKHLSLSGNEVIRVDFTINEKPYLLSKYYSPQAESGWAKKQWKDFSTNAFGGVLSMEEALSSLAYEKPSLVMYRKAKGSKYHEVVGVYWGEL